MIPSPDLLPCGCLLTYSFDGGIRTMTVSPCRPECPNLEAIRNEAVLQDKAVFEREA